MEKGELQDVTVPLAVQPLDSNSDLTMFLMNNFLSSILQNFCEQLTTFSFILLFEGTFYVFHRKKITTEYQPIFS